MAETILDQGVGWGIGNYDIIYSITIHFFFLINSLWFIYVVLGFGAFFAIVMSLITMAQKRYLQEEQSSEMFMTAHRSVKTGLVAAAVVSSMTWAATLLQSSSIAYKYGVSG